MIVRRMAFAFLGAAALIAAVPGSASVGASPAQPAAVTAARYRLTPLVGSSKYLVYSKFRLGAANRVSRTGQLFVTTLTGQPQLLGTVTHADNDFSMAGSMLVYYIRNGGGLTVYWRNLKTEKHGSFAAANEAVAAPNGTVLLRVPTSPGPDVLYLRATTGKVTTLGSPNPYGAGFDERVGGHTLVTGSPYDDFGNGGARYMSFAHPGHFHRLVTTANGGSAECETVTVHYVACYVDKSGPSARLYTTTGKHVVSTRKGCPSASAVLARSIAWVTQTGSCPRHRLTILSPTGTLTVAPGTYRIGLPTSAFGKIVIANRARNELLLIFSATRKQILVHTR